MNVDPNGNFFWLFFVVSAIVGFGMTVAADYLDDGKVFNGSIKAKDYVLNTAVMGFTGGFAGKLLSTVSAFTGSGLALAGGGAIAISSAIETTTAFLGALILFASNSRPGNNQKQNEQFRSVMKKLGYKKSDWQWRFSHDNLPKEKLGYKALFDYIVNLLNRF